MIVPAQTACSFHPSVISFLPQQLTQSSQEVSEPIIVDVSKPDYTSRAKESASCARQRIADYFEPGMYPSTYGAVEMGPYSGM